MSEVCDILRGRRLTKKELSDESQYPVFHGGLQPIGMYHKSNRKGNSVMIVNVGASAGTIGFSEVPFWSSDGCYTTTHENILSQKFLYYFLASRQNYFMSKVRYGGIPTLDRIVLEKYEVPIPPLAEQERIVGILDRFESLTTSLAAGLPAEIAARRRQYEHYRDRLLTFRRKVARGEK